MEVEKLDEFKNSSDKKEKDLCKRYYTSKLNIAKLKVHIFFGWGTPLKKYFDFDFKTPHKDQSELNCVGIHCFAELHACSELQQKSKVYIFKLDLISM